MCEELVEPRFIIEYIPIRRFFGVAIVRKCNQTGCNTKGIYSLTQLTAQVESDLGVHIIPLVYDVSLSAQLN